MVSDSHVRGRPNSFPDDKAVAALRWFDVLSVAGCRGIPDGYVADEPSSDIAAVELGQRFPLRPVHVYGSFGTAVAVLPSFVVGCQPARPACFCGFVHAEWRYQPVGPALWRVVAAMCGEWFGRFVSSDSVVPKARNVVVPAAIGLVGTEDAGYLFAPNVGYPFRPCRPSNPWLRSDGMFFATRRRHDNGRYRFLCRMARLNRAPSSAAIGLLTADRPKSAMWDFAK